MQLKVCKRMFESIKRIGSRREFMAICYYNGWCNENVEKNKFGTSQTIEA